MKNSRATDSNIHFVIIGTLNFFCFLLYVAYYQTSKRMEKRVEIDYPELFRPA